ncbi:MAG: DMT family transporter [Armatimonadota bacterium]
MTPLRIIALVGINTIWGLSYVAAKDALAVTPPILLAFLRFATAALILLPLALLRREDVSRRPYRGLGPAVVGLFSFCGSYILLYVGMSMTSATETAILVNLEPIFTALFGRLFLSEKMTRRRLAGILVAFCGAVLLVRPEQSSASQAVLSRAVGNLCVVAAMAVESAGTILSRHLRSWYSSVGLASRAVAWGSLFLAVPAVWHWTAAGRTTEWLSVTPLAEIGYLSLGCTVIAYLAWYRILARTEAAKAASFIYLQPVIGVAAGTALLGEPLRASAAVAAALIVAGILLTSRSAE